MELRVKVKSDGYHYYAHLPGTSSPSVGGRGYRSYKSQLFDKYFLEAQQNGIADKKIVSYIEDRIHEECDISDWLSKEECSHFYKNKVRNVHKRLKRYEDKLFLVDWNWFVTFTYDSDKETAESFELRLKKCFSNFKTRKNWLVMCVPEEGEEKGRKHFHCFIRIPDGCMVGNLFLNKKYSRKRRKLETWTDNSYFSKRFGISVWESIERNDLLGGCLKSYLVKYLAKSGNKIFYSRGIPTEIDMVIDTEVDVADCFYNYGVKVLLFDCVFAEKGNLSFSFDENAPSISFPGFRLDDLPKIA